MESKNLLMDNIMKIGELFPNCLSEKKYADGVIRKAIDFEKLKQTLSEALIDGEEAYEFNWVGKKKALLDANTPIRKTLRPNKLKSKNWDTTENIYIEGDNFEVLKLLQESYLSSVKMIYIDPPYNTGNDFIGMIFQQQKMNTRRRLERLMMMGIDSLRIPTLMVDFIRIGVQ